VLKTFRIGPLVTSDQVEYFVTAASEGDARSVCAQVVPGATEATNPNSYYCIPSSHYSLPKGVARDSNGRVFSEAINAVRS
jgi:hypothetical protein